MRISDVIERVKSYCHDTDAFSGKPVEAKTTRDQVTYGSIDQPCSGVVVCIWPTAEISCRARQLGANLIITHEALFWNHGDHQDVIADNEAYRAKRALLDPWGGAVWRCRGAAWGVGDAAA